MRCNIETWSDCLEACRQFSSLYSKSYLAYEQKKKEERKSAIMYFFKKKSDEKHKIFLILEIKKRLRPPLYSQKSIGLLNAEQKRNHLIILTRSTFKILEKRMPTHDFSRFALQIG